MTVRSAHPLQLPVNAIGAVITASIEGKDVAAAAEKADAEFQRLLDEDFGG